MLNRNYKIRTLIIMELTSEETREYFRRKWRKPRRKWLRMAEDNIRLKSEKNRENERERSQIVHIDEEEMLQGRFDQIILDNGLSQLDSHFEIYANAGFLEEDEQLDDHIDVILEEGLSY